MSETVKTNTKEKSFQAIDKKIMCMAKDILFKTRFGLGSNKKVNVLEYYQLKLFKDLLCYPLCEPEGKIEEIIKKKLS